MDILLLFIITAAILFFGSMFFGYRDAIRVKVPRGPLAGILNNFKAWNKTDNDGQPKGIVWRQPIWIRLVLSFAIAMVVQIVLWFITPATATDITGGWLSGVSGWVIYSMLIFIGLSLSYLWPKVRSQAGELKDRTFKQGEESTEKEETHRDSKKEKAQDSKPQPESSSKSESESQKKDKDDPNDIINDYLK